MTYDLAYEARVASDILRFARAERRFRIERVALDRVRPLAGELAAIKDGV